MDVPFIALTVILAALLLVFVSREMLHRRRVSQLAADNAQLRQFAFAVAHDLRQPLRAIACFSDLLAQEYGDTLKGEGLEYLSHNSKAARRLDATIHDLLAYVGLTQQAAPRDTDCNTALAEVCEPLGAADVVTSGQLPVIRVNPLRFARLLQNLIGNALKYRDPSRPLAVRVSVEDRGKDWRFAIADNGIGIAPGQLQAIFAPFARLHGDAAYEGSGLGLAIAQRIVEEWGGKLWAESVPGNGSTFYFTVPRRKAAPPSSTSI